MKYKLLQREEELKQKRIQEEEELKQKRIQEEEDLRFSRLRDEQERKHQQQLEEARLRAELDEAQAVMDIHEINKQTNLSSDVPPFHDNKHIVSNLFCNKYASNGIKIDGPSESTAHPTYDKCNPSDDRLTKSMFIADTKLASSASQNHNLGQNVNPEPPFEHSVTQVPGTLNELCYHQSGQLRDVSNRPSFDYSRANAPTCETRFAQSTRGSNLEPVDYNQTIMVPTQQPSSYSRSNVDRPETSNKELSTSSRNFPVPNAAYQSPVIMSPSATPLLEPDVFDGNPACYRNFIEAFDALIAFNVPEPKRKLFYLLSYTKGPAHSLVKGCQYMDDALGYLKARKLLQQTFGQKFQIAKACVDSLTNGPMLHVNDKPSLLSFSADINSCMNTLKGMNYLHKMDNLDVITKVAKRLPHQWLSGWQAEVDSLIHQKGQEVSIENLAAYVTIKTRQTTNLDCNWAQSSRKPDLHKPRKETTLAAQTVLSPSKPCCKLCKGPHYLNQCKRFRKYVYEDRIKFVNESKLCRSCLEPGHFAKNCSRKSPCKRPDCNGSHTTLLHPPEKCTLSTSATNQMDSPADSALSHIAVRNGLVGVPTQTRGSLPIVPVRIRMNNSEQSIITQAFLDTGSTSSFITNDLIDKLGIRQSPVVKVTTVTINHGTDTRKAKVISDLEISDVFESSPYSHLQPLLSIQRLPATIDDAPSQDDISESPEFADIFIPRVNSDVGLLIGNDNRHILKPHEIINSGSDHYAIRTAVGWVVSCSKRGSSTTSCKNFLAKTESGYIHPMCTLCSDVIDTLHNVNEMSREQLKFMEHVEKSIYHRKDKHYEIALPLRSPDLNLPANLALAEQRARYLKQKFLKNPPFFEEYKQFMEDTISKGYAEKIDDKQGQEGRIWYIPHHGIYHKNKPGKIRVVFDCSARYKGVCLNDHLLPGPDITNSLIGVLLRFRREPIAIQGDVQSMFHQVQIPTSDRDLLRFLWWENGSLDNDLESYRMCVYLFGTVSSPSCANFALRQTALDHEREFSPGAIDTVKNCFYVDDCLTSAPNANSAAALLREIFQLLDKGGFRITKWTSNSREVIKTVPPSDRSNELKNLDLTKDSLPKERSLGLCWDAETDTLCFKVRIKVYPSQCTRRVILSVVNSVYDPLGFGAPAVQPMKALLQDLCRKKLDWDQEIPPENKRVWMEWLRQLPLLASFQLPRCYKPSTFGNVIKAQLYHFSDASERSFGYVSYLRLVNDNNQSHCALLIGKTKLTPLKPLTTPRLELCAATISVKFDNVLRKELHLPHELQPSIFWTDSTTVLCYINNETKVFHTFVSNRIQQIRNSSNPSQWRYVSSEQNPADDPSRGLSIDEFLRRDRWKLGPDFLWKAEDKWPDQPTLLQENLPEQKFDIQRHSCLTVLCESPHFLDDLISRYSSWQRLLRVCAWILRFKNLVSPTESEYTATVTKPKVHVSQKRITCLSLEEISKAEMLIFSYLQHKYYKEEIDDLSKGKPVRTSSSLIKLSPFIKNGLMHVGGRLKLAASLPFLQKHQIILPRSNHVTNLIIRDIHTKLGHAGRQHVLAEIRKKFWLIRANATIRKILNSCVACRKRSNISCTQQMADLPPRRLTPNKPPFSSVGVDFFGPFLTRKGRSNSKRYGVIFTCLTTRAIHLEVAYNLDTSSFIQALRRFVARRGQVTEIVSDNGTNFIGGERELREAIQAWNNEQINDFLLQKGISWSFNPPGASHHGGTWERLIRSIRKHLKSVCNEQILTDESLSTLMCEIESILNSRPLTTVSNDPYDLEPLTPNHLLLLKPNGSLPPGVFDKRDSYSRKQWRQVQYLSNVFWSRWIKEYLPTLQRRQKWTRPARNLTVNDVVLVHDKGLPRNTWLLGRIVEVYPDPSGFVRTVKLQTKQSYITRPITKLTLLHAAES